MGVSRRIEQLLDSGESAASRRGTGLNGFVGAVEIIPCERLDVGAQNQVCVALPYFELVLLSGADGAADYLKYVGWSAALPIFDANRNGDDMVGAKIARGACGNLRDQASIGEAARTDFNGFEQAWESAARTDGFGEISVSENDGFSVGQVRGDDGHGNLQILEALRFEDLLDKIA
jgi:hypothetical protein